MFLYWVLQSNTNLTLKSSTDQVLSAHTKAKWIGHNPQPSAARGAHTTTRGSVQWNAAATNTQMDNLKYFVYNEAIPFIDRTL